jgi:hypothetical protein
LSLTGSAATTDENSMRASSVHRARALIINFPFYQDDRANCIDRLSSSLIRWSNLEVGVS